MLSFLDSDCQNSDKPQPGQQNGSFCREPLAGAPCTASIFYSLSLEVNFSCGLQSVVSQSLGQTLIGSVLRESLGVGDRRPDLTRGLALHKVMGLRCLDVLFGLGGKSSLIGFVLTASIFLSRFVSVPR